MSSVFLLRRASRTLANSRAAVLDDGRWQLAGCSERATECFDALRSCRPDVLACDLRLADGHAQRLLLQLRRLERAPKVLLFTSLAHDTSLFDTLAGGAHGYMVECETGSHLVSALQALQSGQALMSPQLARQTLATMGLERVPLERAQTRAAGLNFDRVPVIDAESSLRFEEMTRADQSLLSLIALGRLPAEIAQLWRLGSDTIGRRLSEIYGKLHRLQRARHLDLALV